MIPSLRSTRPASPPGTPLGSAKALECARTPCGAIENKAAAAAALFSMAPQGVLAHSSALAEPSGVPGGDAGRVDLSEGIIDLHCHPSLKIYLLNKKIWLRHHPWPGPNMIHM